MVTTLAQIKAILLGKEQTGPLPVKASGILNYMFTTRMLQETNDHTGTYNISSEAMDQLYTMVREPQPGDIVAVVNTGIYLLVEQTDEGKAAVCAKIELNEDFIYQMDTNYEIWIYVSSEASKEQISKLDEFLEGLYEMDSSREYQITFEVHPLVFEPDDNSRFVFEKPYTFRYEKQSPHPEHADIDKHIHVGEFDRRDPSHVPESVEDGVMLIVVR